MTPWQSAGNHRFCQKSRSKRLPERAAEKAVEKMTNQIYLEVGKGVVKKALYMLGALVVGAGLWAKAKGWI